MVVREAGLASDSILHARNGFPPKGKLAVSVDTDDVIMFEQSNVAEMQGCRIALLFCELDRIWQKYRIVAKDSTCVDRSPNDTAFGIDLVDGRFLLPKRARLREVVVALIFLPTVHSTSPHDFAHFWGAPVGTAHEQADAFVLEFGVTSLLRHASRNAQDPH